MTRPTFAAQQPTRERATSSTSRAPRPTWSGRFAGSRPRSGGALSRRGGTRRDSSRDRESKLGAAPQGALRPDLSAVHLNDLARDHKAKPGACDLVLPTDSLVSLKQAGDVFSCNPNARVLDCDSHVVAFEFRADLNLAAFRRVLDRIAEQVRDDLKQAVCIRHDRLEPHVEV